MKIDLKEQLIIINGKDRTNFIDSIFYSGKGKYQVIFKNSLKVYYYMSPNILVFNNPKKIDLTSDIIIYKGQQVNNVLLALNFDNRHIKIFFKHGNQSQIYYNSELSFVKNTLSNPKAMNCFDYLKQLSKITSIRTEDDKLLLNEQYEKMESINPNSVLSKYLNYNSLGGNDKYLHLIFPFGFNLSQKTAVTNAFSSNISIIEGPPGTGKTQTILNIIANAVLNHKTVAVVSNNNSATSNVIEKLAKNKLDFFAAFLGNRANKDRFIELQSEEYPDFTEWYLSNEKTRDLLDELENKEADLETMNEARNLEAQKQSELDNLKVEQNHFALYFQNKNITKIKIKTFYRIKASKISNLLAHLDLLGTKISTLSLKEKVIIFILYGIYSLEFLNQTIENMIDNLQLLYYENRVKECETVIGELQKKLENFDFENKMKNYQENSMSLFRAKLFSRYGKGKRKQFSNDDFWKNTEEFMKEYPVILSTTHSLRNCTNSTYLFDYLIIDESSQVDIVTGALALSCAKHVIIVGDEKQLPNVVTEEIKMDTNKLFVTSNLGEEYRYSDHSLLSSCIAIFKDAPRTLLREHYRCHPKIIEFCNQKFYNNELIILAKSNNNEPLCVYKTAEGNHSRDHYNQRQIDVIVNEIFVQKKIGQGDESVGIITPYVNQKSHLIEAVENNPNIEIDTVHKFQGREKDVIIISTVDDDINEFSDNPNLLNVAISRAKNKLIVVVPNEYSSVNSNMGDLIKYIQYNNLEVIDSNIYSVFDFLYKDYSRSLLKEMAKNKNISKYYSENLMNGLVLNILCDKQFGELDYIFGQPLKMLIKDSLLLNERENKFVKSSGSHIDFLIYKKVTKEPLLAIEVDGYAYHENNPEQLVRDKLKDGILEKCKIPIIRFKTNESNEKERLTNKLLDIIK